MMKIREKYFNYVFSWIVFSVELLMIYKIISEMDQIDAFTIFIHHQILFAQSIY
jgi:hypothetical protein